MRILKKQDIYEIMYGATFFGAGGGGSIKDGMLLYNLMDNDDTQVEMYDVEEMKESDYAVMVAGLGSPLALEKARFSEEATNVALGAMEIAKKDGKELTHLYSGEMGGFNTLVPIYAAMTAKIPMIDMDGQGRAVPELNTGLGPIYQIPTYPLVLSNKAGDVIAAYTKDPMDSKACETIARSMCMAYDMSIGFSTWMMKKDELLKVGVLGQITRAQEAGKAILKAKDEGSDVVDELRKMMTLRELVRGEVADVQLKTEGGFDYGTTVIQDKDGNKYFIYLKNENLLVRNQDGEALITVPDLISMIDLEATLPLTNTDLHVGQKVTVIASPAHANWWAIPEGFGCWTHLLEKVGYTKNAVPFCK